MTGFGACSGDFDQLSDDQIVKLSQAIAECERRLGSYKTHAAGQLARRSARERGHSGLAARHGFSSPEKMLHDVTKSSGREAVQVVALGRLLDEAEAARRLLERGIADIGGNPVVVPWQAALATAIAEGTLSIACGDALRRGLGSPTEQVSSDVLRERAEKLIAQATNADSGSLSADRLFKEARLQRDLIDVDGLLDLDGLLELVTLGAALDPQKMQLKMRTLVTIVTVVDDSRSVGAQHVGASRANRGVGLLEANGELIARGSVDRSLCEGDTVMLDVMSTGDPLKLGRTARLFNQRQREALSARDGGCLWPGCDRPPAFTEAHHTRQWKGE